MLARQHTLPRKDFNKVIQEGRAYKSRAFYLKVLENNTSRTRIGVAVAKKLTARAVRRNYYKRVLRHILSETISDTSLGYDIVLIASEDIKGKKFEDLLYEVKNLLNKVWD